MRSEELTIVYKLDTFAVELALEGIQAVLAGDGLPLGGFKRSGALTRLKRAKRKTFNIVSGGFEFDLSCLRNFQLDFLSIKAAGDQCPSWDKWAAWFIGDPNFVMGWLADVEYEYWQNAHDLLEYTAVGKPHEHLPKKSNALPPPLEQTIIDISGNPGRRILRNGYYEVVGAVMWLGEPFWQLTRPTKSKLSGHSGFNSRNLGGRWSESKRLLSASRRPKALPVNSSGRFELCSFPNQRRPAKRCERIAALRPK